MRGRELRGALHIAVKQPCCNTTGQAAGTTAGQCAGAQLQADELQEERGQEKGPATCPAPGTASAWEMLQTMFAMADTKIQAGTRWSDVDSKQHQQLA
ncbi:hypothetical protein Anapl_07310 [Anas platyrhynchos]|uniref:Uncharacterized protein n=1 Tax=Anas platyrhynchos TaxID=8839 RepID=R0JPU0_ANAPL|nr:hypothetical protein Anapl_07310 [Anas platyrhynchos]